MLHGIREGVLARRRQGARSTCSTTRRGGCSASWRRSGWASGSRTSCPTGRLRRVVTGEVEGSDLVAVTDEHLLVLNRMPVVGGRPQRRVGGDDPGPHRARGAAAPARLGRGADHGAARPGARVLQPAARPVRPARARRGRGGDALQPRSSRPRRRWPARRSGPGSVRRWSPRCCWPRPRSPRSATSSCASTRPAGSRPRQCDEDLPIVTVLGNLIDNAVDAVADDPGTRRRQPAWRGHGLADAASTAR